jgi:PEP-CTERM motif
MRMKIVLALILSLALAWRTKAQSLTGSLSASDVGTFASFTSSSVTLVHSNIINFDSGSFGTSVPTNSLLTVPSGFFSTTINGLSSTPLSDSINNFFVFSSPLGGFGGSTTPANRFDFDLATITENSDNGTTATFSGTGTIVDTTGAFQDTPGQFTVDFLSPGQYTLTLEAVPEPATISVAVTGLLGAWALRRRKGWNF